MKVVYINTQSAIAQSAKDNDVLYELTYEHEAALRRFIRIRARANSSETEDILQEMYTKLFSLDGLAAKTEERQDTFRSFLFKVVTNLIIDRERRAKVRAQEEHESFSDTHYSSKANEPEEQANIAEKLSDIEKVLNNINPVHKTAFVLCRVEGKAYREISDILGVSVSTVEKYISAALTAIRNKVQN
ncbi:RNA polymerase sigma factor [Aliiglaciecola sp. 3_MG-2023]|uniref:RNA polymerase sigma factor n=1 Tax=Aliiglaciecola sp. 3_MG-2023 TaxID=3062644 RepID=UPI0026E3FE72|nr:RNA polymerase sigma factor [Aliiglaciecola sp. 3_MG-2023]MDO6693192.1 RNA polymerase sigma factor [Aliiglaciecola sp. 3_MG-2023]